MKRFFKIFLYTFAVIVVLLVAALFLVQREQTQNWLAQKGVRYLKAKLGTDVAVKHIKIDFLNRVHLQGFYLADQNHDTLLYAGDLMLNTSDWIFIRKDKPTIKSISLKDAYINLNRLKDSTWNYDFISSAFSSPSGNTNSTQNVSDTSSSSTGNFEIDLKLLAFDNVHFNYIDKWAGENFIITLPEFDLDAEQIDVPNKQVHLNAITFNKANIVYADYPGLKPRKPKQPRDTSPFNDDNWRIDVSSLKLNQSSFAYNKDFDQPREARFDEEHINAQQINIDIKNIEIKADTILAKIKNLSAVERCGLQVKQMYADVEFSPIKAKLENLYLATNRSVVRDYYEMDYANFTDFNDYITKVFMKANFNDAYVDFADIAYFGPEIKNINFKHAKIKSGNFEGTVEKFLANKLDLQTANTHLIGDVEMKGLPDIDATYISINAQSLRTSGAQLKQFVPEVKNDAVDFQTLGDIQFVGSYKGYIHDFVAKGNIQTSLGNIYSDLHMKLPAKAVPAYDGYLATKGFNLGTLLNTNEIGRIALNGNVNGRGFSLDELNTQLNTQLDFLETKNYTYHNIRIDGNLTKNKFSGKLNANDPALVMNFDGELDLSGAKPNYNLKSKMVHFDLQKLGLSSEAISGSALVDVNFSGKTIDDFAGKAKLYNLTLNRDGKHIYLDSAILRSYENSGEKTLSVQSSVANADIHGKFNVAELPYAMQLYMSYYLPEYIRRPKNVLPQQFDFNIQLFDISPIISTFYPDVRNINEGTLSGSLNMNNQSLNLLAEFPDLAIQDVNIHDVRINTSGNYDKLDIAGSTGTVFNSGEALIPSTMFSSSLFNDSALLQVNTNGGAYNLKDAKLDIKAFANNNTFFVEVLPSEFYLRESKWKASSSDEYVIFDKEGIQSIKDLTLESGAQKININTDVSNHKNIIADVENLDMNEVSVFAGLDENVINGRINGEIKINDFLGDNVFTGEIQTSSITYLGDTLGELSLDVAYDQMKEQIIIENNSGLVFNDNKTFIKGKVNLKDTNNAYDLNLSLNQFPVKVLEKFLTDFISSTEGVASGDIAISGRLSNPNFDGDLFAKNVKTKINYLNTVYSIPKLLIDVSTTQFKIKEDTKIYDEAGRSANIYKGIIKHQLFDHFDLDIGINTTGFLFLNTGIYDNSVYYGKVIASGMVDIYGPLDYLTMDILGRVKEGTHLNIPLNTEVESAQYDFIRFKTYGKAEVAKQKKRRASRMFVNIRAESSPDADISIITDPSSGDRIDCSGTTNDFSMNIDVGNDIKIYGSYIIEKGNYNYKFKGLVNKDFSIEQGSSIVWSGDPGNAKMNVVATYTSKTDKSLEPLYEKGINYDGDQNATRKFKTQIQIALDGDLSRPIPAYKIIQPDNNDESSIAYRTLQNLNTNEQAKLTQVGMLLLTDNFIASSELDNNALQAVGSTGIVNTVNDLLAPTLSNIVTQSLQRLSVFKNTVFNVRYNNQADSLSQFNTNQVRLNIQQSFLNDRLIIQVGNSLNYFANNTNANGSQLKYNFDDIQINYLLSRSGQFRLSAFSKQNNAIANISNSENTTINGVGITYKKSFNTFKDFVPWLYRSTDTISWGTH